MADTTVDDGLPKVTNDLDLSKLLAQMTTAPQADPQAGGQINVAAAIQGMQAAAPGAKAKVSAAAQAGIAKQTDAAAAAAIQANNEAARYEQMRIVQDALVKNMKDKKENEDQVLVHSVADAYATPGKLIQLSQQIDAADAKLTPQAADIAKRQRNGFFDDPMQWMYDQFALSSDIKAHNMDVDARNNLAHQRDAAVVDGSQAANFIKSTTVAKTADQVAAEATSTAMKALSDVATSKAVAARFSIPYLQQAMQDVKGSFGEQMAQINYNLNASNQAFNQAHIKNFVEPQMKLQEQLTQKVLEDRDAKEAILKTVNAKLFDPADKSQGLTVAAFDLLPKVSQTAVVAVGVAAHGSNVSAPSQLLDSWNALGMPLSPKSAEIQQAMNASRQELEIRMAKEKMTDFAMQSPEARKAAVDLEFNKQWSSFNKLPAIDAKPGLGMLTFGEMNAYTQGELKDNVVYKSITGGNAANPGIQQTRITTQQIDNAAAALVTAGGDPKLVAAQAALLFQTTTNHNTHISDLASFGLPAQTSWMANSPGFANKTFSGDTTNLWDHTDQAAYQNWLMRQKASGLAGRMANSLVSTLDSLQKLPYQMENWKTRNIFGHEPSEFEKVIAGEKEKK